ncbi:MAG: hypothetical protein FWD11_04740 [Micrococcales bacterium]|nr:hypothetical protein [Micrococcales bacterium]
MADRIAVDADALVHLATGLEQVGDDIRAVATADRTCLDPEAMGPLCSFLLVPLQAAAAAGQATMASAATMVGWTGQVARTWAGQATGSEQDVLDTVRTLDLDTTL